MIIDFPRDDHVGKVNRTEVSDEKTKWITRNWNVFFLPKELKTLICKTAYNVNNLVPDTNPLMEHSISLEQVSDPGWALYNKWYVEFWT